MVRFNPIPFLSGRKPQKATEQMAEWIPSKFGNYKERK